MKSNLSTPTTILFFIACIGLVLGILTSENLNPNFPELFTISSILIWIGVISWICFGAALTIELSRDIKMNNHNKDVNHN